MTDRSEFVDEFANTFQEWHYLAGGASVGVVIGLFVAVRWFRRVEVARSTTIEVEEVEDDG